MAGVKGRSGNKPLPKEKLKILKAFRLRPEHLKFIQEQVAKGKFKDETSVIEAALKLLIQLD